MAATLGSCQGLPGPGFLRPGLRFWNGWVGAILICHTGAPGVIPQESPRRPQRGSDLGSTLVLKGSRMQFIILLGPVQRWGFWNGRRGHIGLYVRDLSSGHLYLLVGSC